MIVFRPPGTTALAAVLERESDSEPTYAEVGATAGTLPPGYLHIERSIEIGSGQEVFETASRYLLSWQLQVDTGFGVFPPDDLVAEARTVLLTIPAGPLFFVAGVRVVYVVSDERRQGFAYATLPSHPETGEQYFGVTIDESGTVRFEMRSFSRPRALVARLGAPISRLLQRKVLDRYDSLMAALGDG